MNCKRYCDTRSQKEKVAHHGRGVFGVPHNDRFAPVGTCDAWPVYSLRINKSDSQLLIWKRYMHLSRSSQWGVLFVVLTLTACSPVRPSAAPTATSRPAATRSLNLTAVATGIYAPAYVPPALATNLTNPGGTSAMAFSSGPYGNAGIYLANFANRTITQLTHAQGNSFDLDWSPDGSKIIFRTDRDGQAPFRSFDAGEIYVMEADGSNQTNLTNSPAIDGWPKWSPDGSRIVFASYRDGH